MTTAAPLEKDLTTLLKRICETSAPTFDEGERGQLVAELLGDAGLSPERDSAGNVTAAVPGGSGPRVLVAAHLDTVFAAPTDVTVKKRGAKLAAPGIGDNSASLSVLVHYARLSAELKRPRLTLAATVGEEGLGDLYGMRELMRARAGEFDYVIALDGHLGTIVHQAVGSKRFEVQFEAVGGHSWGDYPSPSAVHALGEAVHALGTLELPKEPRSTLNVGQVAGGTSINAIAQTASFNLDLRSLDAETLSRLAEDALTHIRRTARRHRVKVNINQVGDRAAVQVDNRALVKAARRALQACSVPVRTAASSTDANASMAAGLPSIAFGVYRGGDAHRLSEWLEPASLSVGFRAFSLLLGALSELKK